MAGLATNPPLRRVEPVRSPSAGRETGAVAKAAFHIIFWTGMLIAVERGDARIGAKKTSATGVGEIAFRDLDSADQRVFRALREGLTEAENVRAATGAWPPTEALAAQGIPPFAADPIDKAGYRWTLLRQKLIVNYAGVPAVASRPSFLAVIQEPDPGTPIDPQAKPDDIHHRLPDGRMLHVTVWKGPGLRELREPLAVPPIETGWGAIVVAAN